VMAAAERECKEPTNSTAGFDLRPTRP
jgi:hypothetical protein